MRIHALFRKLFPLFYSKSVLLICNHKSKVFIQHSVLNHGMSSYYDFGQSQFNSLIRLSFFLCGHRTGQKLCSYGNTAFLQHFADSFIMLNRQNLCRCHQSTLKSCKSCIQKTCQSHNCFSRTYISLYKPVHCFFSHKISAHFLQHSFLCICQRIWKLLQKFICLFRRLYFIFI